MSQWTACGLGGYLVDEVEYLVDCVEYLVV